MYPTTPQSASIMVGMKERDHRKLKEIWGHLYRGGLPDLGKPHSKAGYRWCVGMADYGNGKVDHWRENLGHDLLVAQYRAREMTDLWMEHVEDCIREAEMKAGISLAIETVQIPPLNREQAKQQAWEASAKALVEPMKMARQATAALQRADDGRLGPAISPGFRIVAVPANLRATATAVAEAIEPVATGTLPLTFHAAVKKWVQHLKRRHEQNDLSDDYLQHISGTTARRMVELSDDYPLATFGKVELDTIRLAFQNRRKKNGQPWSRTTIKKELDHVTTFCRWLDENELWPSPPRKWEKCLKPKFRDDTHDDDVDRAKAHDTYSLDELKKLYGAAGYSCRMWLLCALNFGWGQTEIATARKKHFKTAQPEKRRVARYRHKRRPGANPVLGRWQAWPETWDAAMTRIGKTPTDEAINPKGLAFLTAQDKPLVRHEGRGRRDAIKDAFEELCEAAHVRCRGFYLLRHTGINLIKRIAGKETADLYCQHAPTDITSGHYLNADWRRLFGALRKLRVKLQPLFDAADEQPQSDQPPV